MRILYHFRNSPFARRVRLALAHKGLDVELREARESPEHFEELKRRTPFVTVPVLVEEDGRLIGDSTAIVHYLDRAYPDRPLWPVATDEALAVFDTAALVDDALDTIITAGNRFYKLHEHPAWPDVLAAEVARVQRALDGLAARMARLERPTFSASGWSAADMWVYTAVAWLRGLPERAKTFPLPRQLASLGWRLPDELATWAVQHDSRPDVRALEVA